MSQQANDAERVRNYLLSQGERYSYVQLWPRLVKARMELLDSLQDVSEDQARFKPEENEWSISEVALHVLNGSRSVARLVTLLAAGQTALSDPIDPPREETGLTIAEFRDHLLRDAIRWSAMTEQLPESPSFDTTALHQFFGELNSREWYLFQRIHDVDHLRQIEAIKGSPGYPS